MSCEFGASICHSNAECYDHEDGSCCRCNPGFYGNGELCLANSVAQRVTGTVSGLINGVSFSEQSVHSYVVTEDGRTYTAISKISDSIGMDMQVINSIYFILSPVLLLLREGIRKFSLVISVDKIFLKINLSLTQAVIIHY